MRSLVECLREWLAVRRTDGKAYTLLLALTLETLKVIDSSDSAQREFDALDLAQAAGMGQPNDFEAAKRWVETSNVVAFVKARTLDLEEFFAARGHKQCLRPVKRSPAGKHRAQWFLETYDMPLAPAPRGNEDSQESSDQADAVTYDYTPPGGVKPAWWTWPFLGSGSFVTRSPRGLLWAALIAASVAELIGCLVVLWAFSFMRHPIQMGDVAGFLGVTGAAWFIWKFQLDPLTRLVDDRLILAGGFWPALKEDPAQLELAREGDRRVLRLVRYTAVCPACAGTL